MESEPQTPALSRSSSFASVAGGELPGWIPDSAAKECMSCKRSFGFSRRRHHCRNCGWCICSDCSKNSIALSHMATQAPQRVCNDCFENLRQVQQLRMRTAGLRSITGMANTRGGSVAATPSRSRSISVDQFASPGTFMTPGVIIQPMSGVPSPAAASSSSTQASPQAPHQSHHARIASMPVPPATSTVPITPVPDAAFPPSPSPTPSPHSLAASVLSSSASPSSSSSSQQLLPQSPQVSIPPPATFTAASAALSPQPASPSSPTAASTAASAQLQMLPLSVPAWSYVFKPFSPAGAEVSVGRIAVTIRGGESFPPLDSMFNSSSSPYVVVRLGNGRKRTHTLSLSNAAAAASPDWSVPNAASPLGTGDGNGTNVLVLDVPNVLEVLHIEVWEANQLGKDMMLASTEIPLASQVARAEYAVPDAGLLPASLGGSSSRSFRVDAWVPMRLSAALVLGANKMHNQALAAVSTLFHPSEWANMSAEKKRAVAAKKEAELRAKAAAAEKQRKAHASSHATASASHSLADRPPPRLHVELAYSYSTLGEFWSHFTPPLSASSGSSVAGLSKAERRAKRAEEKARRRAAAGEDAEEDKSDEERSDDDSDGEEDETATQQSQGALLSAEEGAVEPFRLQTSYELLRRSLALVHPLYAGLSTLSHALSPSSHPLLWLLLSALLFACAWRPAMIPVLAAMVLVRHMAWSWLYRRHCGGAPHVLDEEWQNYSNRAAAAAAASSSGAGNTAGSGEEKRRSSVLSSALQMVNPLKLVSAVTPLFKRGGGDAAPQQEEQHPDVGKLERMLAPLLRLTLLTLGAPADSATLALIQSRWSRALDALQSVRDALDWTGSGGVASVSLFALLCAFALGCLCFSPVVPLALLAAFLLSRETVLGKQLEWILASTAAAGAESNVVKGYLALCGSGKVKQA